MGRLSRLVVGSVGLCAVLAGLGTLAALLSFILDAGAKDDGGWTVIASLVEMLPFGVLPIWLGLGLIRKARAANGSAPNPLVASNGARLTPVGDPGIAGRFVEDQGGAPRTSAEPPRLREFLKTSPGLGLAIGAGSLALMLVFRPVAGLVALIGTTVYAVVDPSRNTARRSWWLGALVSVCVWLILLPVLAGVADQLTHMRESTMVFLVPFMLYPAALVVSGIVRLVRGGGRREPPPPS